MVSLHSFVVYHTKVYEEWTGHRTTAFKGVLLERLACIKVELIFNMVEYCSFTDLFLISRFVRCFTALFCTISYYGV